MTLPKIINYGNYSSDNYGVNSLRISFDNLTLWYSYDTIVAFQHRDDFQIRENDWSTTTGKHLNWIDDNKKRRISGEEFEIKLGAVLKELGLA